MSAPLTKDAGLPISSYDYPEAGPRWDDSAIFAALCAALPVRAGRLLDAGCGNGFMASRFAGLGFTVTGVDPSSTGIAVARRTYPGLTFLQEDITQHRADTPYDIAICVEVLEHVYDPQAFLHGLAAALKPGGRLLLTTPYYGYGKFLAIALLGRMPRHVNPLWLGGHIKLFTRATLIAAVRGAGFGDVRCRGVGRVPYFWKSMLLTARTPVGA
jgi:2-polyprenyl-3-methyl-5-hydroxy-6-metoxy-1,4-benzoquinol methylase